MTDPTQNTVINRKQTRMASSDDVNHDKLYSLNLVVAVFKHPLKRCHNKSIGKFSESHKMAL